jgi:hypothetical protein
MARSALAASDAASDASERVGDRGDIVVGWLVRIVVTVAILGVILFDAVSVGAAKMSVTDEAGDAARAASDSWLSHHDQQAAFDAAWQAAITANAANTIDTTTFRVEQNGTVHLTLERTAPTLVLHLVGPLDHWADVSSEGVGRAST